MNLQHVLIVQGALKRALDLAEKLDLVITVEQVPKTPLAMGNYTTVSVIREARHPKNFTQISFKEIVK